MNPVERELRAIHANPGVSGHNLISGLWSLLDAAPDLRKHVQGTIPNKHGTNDCAIAALSSALCDQTPARREIMQRRDGAALRRIASLYLAAIWPPPHDPTSIDSL